LHTPCELLVYPQGDVYPTLRITASKHLRINCEWEDHP
jgi:hypothetical protein